ncbi:MAG: DUF4384 domain-containing protein [Pseudomonadales bacterium]
MSLKLRLIGSLLTVLTTYAAADTSRDLTIVQRPIEQIEPAEQGEPDDPSGAGPLKVSVAIVGTGTLFQPGETVTFELRVNQPAYVWVLDVGSSGKTHLIFPNDHQAENFVQPDQPVRIPGDDAPFRFEVGGPAGPELVKVFASPNDEPLIDAQMLQKAGAFRAVTATTVDLARDLSVTLAQPKHEGWAEARVTFHVGGEAPGDPPELPDPAGVPVQTPPPPSPVPPSAGEVGP